MHSGSEVPEDELPRELLPVEYGGENGTIDELIKYWEQKVIENRDYLIEELQFGTDESKRLVPSKHHDTLFGPEDCLEKLEVD